MPRAARHPLVNQVKHTIPELDRLLKRRLSVYSFSQSWMDSICCGLSTGKVVAKLKISFVLSCGYKYYENPESSWRWIRSVRYFIAVLASGQKGTYPFINLPMNRGIKNSPSARTRFDGNQYSDSQPVSPVLPTVVLVSTMRVSRNVYWAWHFFGKCPRQYFCAAFRKWSALEVSCRNISRT